MKSVSRGIDRVAVTFDEPNLVANAGLLLVATLVVRLGLEQLCDATIDLAGRVGGFRPGRKILTLVHAMVAGASHIDHADMLRAGSTKEVLGHRVMAPSTIGTFLRAFTFGHVRQFEKVIAEVLERAWAMGAGPGEERLVVDVDSTIEEVHGKKKHGAAYGYTNVLGYHPLVATRAGTGEILHARLRKGSANTARGVRRFIEELVPRLRRAGAAGQIVMRFDSGYWSQETITVLGRLSVNYTMAIRTGTKAVTRAIEAIDEKSWVEIDYPEGGRAQVSETTYKGRRLVVRRTRLVGPQATLWPNWRHFGFLTDLTGPAVEMDAFHRQHATVELAIDDWKEGAGMAHCPSGNFSANGAWLCCAVLAHNLVRWTAALGTLKEDHEALVVARTLRTRYFAVPARLVNHSGRPTLRMPERWPWATKFTTALRDLRAVAFAPT
ncbi:MAG TPA: IS1380 family transposase [Acidimicrobiales bacterium]|nr:IS1380 family transposase [Acidimicrobiales bacterium]